MANKCRDCKKCKERGITRFAKKAANAALIVGTVGTSALAAQGIKVARENCPVCGHALAMHSIIDGRFKD